MKLLERLKSIELKKLKANPNKTLSITAALQRINASNSDLMHLAQKAFICYIRSVFLNKDKEIFNISKINHEAFAASLGLVTTPIIEFINNESKTGKKSKLNKLREKIKRRKMKELEENEDQKESQSEPEEEIEEQESSEHIPDEEEDDEDLFVLKRKIEPTDESDHEIETIKKFSKNKLKKITKEGISRGKNKLYFDKDGNPVSSFDYHLKKGEFNGLITNEEEDKEEVSQAAYMNKIKESLAQHKEIDNQIASERLKKKRIKKRKQKEDLKKQMEKEKTQEYYEIESEGDGNNDQDDQDEDE